MRPFRAAIHFRAHIAILGGFSFKVKDIRMDGDTDGHTLLKDAGTHLKTTPLDWLKSVSSSSFPSYMPFRFHPYRFQCDHFDDFWVGMMSFNAKNFQHVVHAARDDVIHRA